MTRPPAIPDPTHAFLRFYRAVDEGDFAVAASLIAPDGAWSRLDRALRTEAEIAEALSSRSPTRSLHHLFTNVYAEYDGDQAEVVGFMLVVSHDPGAPAPGPALLRGIDSIRTTRARLRRIGDGWGILSLRSDPVSFAAPAS